MGKEKKFVKPEAVIIEFDFNIDTITTSAWYGGQNDIGGGEGGEVPLP